VIKMRKEKVHCKVVFIAHVCLQDVMCGSLVHKVCGGGRHFVSTS
jgi:hypothetical protein